MADEGLWVEFIGRDLFVPWEDIMELKFTGMKQIGLRRYGSWVVKTKGNRLTFFHRFYGLIYAATTSPCFVFYPSIENEKELIKSIQQRERIIK